MLAGCFHRPRPKIRPLRAVAHRAHNRSGSGVPASLARPENALDALENGSGATRRHRGSSPQRRT